jgi:hypothetical protein
MRMSAIGNHTAVRRATDLFMKIVPIGGLIAIASYFAAQQAVSPQHRIVKLAVLLGLMAFMLRFDMVYSVLLFTILYPFPSGISIGSTNSILMTIIPLIWAVRAASTGAKIYFQKTRLDVPIILFLLAYVISFFNVGTTPALLDSLKIMWRTVATVMYFYMIVTFVNDDRKIILMTKVIAIVCGLVMSTAIVELFAPGASIIPGWIGLEHVPGEGLMSYRVKGMRVGGALRSHSMLSDFGTQMFFLIVYHFVRSRNPIGKLLWGAIALLTITAVVATANRGAAVGFAIGGCYSLYLFRKQISLPRMIMIIATVVGLFAAAEAVLTRYTYATSLADRFLGTEFQGIVPDTRVTTWKPALEEAMKHPFIGHGPSYNLGEGLSKRLWPHNGFIFYMCTIGVIGLLTFLAIIYRVVQYSLSFRTKGIQGTPLGDLSRILHVILVVMLFQQNRTDHQRDDMYPFIVWMIFGMVTATALVIQRRYGSASEPVGEGPAPFGPAGGGGSGEPGRRRRTPGRALPGGGTHPGGNHLRP